MEIVVSVGKPHYVRFDLLVVKKTLRLRLDMMLMGTSLQLTSDVTVLVSMCLIDFLGHIFGTLIHYVLDIVDFRMPDIVVVVTTDSVLLTTDFVSLVIPHCL